MLPLKWICAVRSWDGGYSSLFNPIMTRSFACFLLKFKSTFLKITLHCFLRRKQDQKHKRFSACGQCRNIYILIVLMKFCIWVGHPFTTTVVEKSDWRLSMRRVGKQKQMILAFKVVHICFLSNGGSPLSFDPIRNIKSNTVPHGLLNHAKKKCQNEKSLGMLTC